ncbi:hypothetical protein J2786_002406 [Chryseobacterium vietnamense]|uniref:Uncharacterized protein n=1 Tax=Chryseobacterium vietnamense TaxID=866785 RepID=A0ACC6J8Y9_9FLAO|nr:hypothetical protein [Chryseobacterium vietnamense]
MYKTNFGRLLAMSYLEYGLKTRVGFSTRSKVTSF